VKYGVSAALLLCAGFCLVGCSTGKHSSPVPSQTAKFDPGPLHRPIGLTTENEDKILAMDPESVTESEVREVLSHAPAPRIITIHGGLLPITVRMDSFARFLVTMGYPESSIRHPADGAYTYGYYDRSARIAGAVAWYYERDGLRPMLIGHSVGGIQVIRILHKLAGDMAEKLPVWNPVTESEEERYEIVDPLGGTNRPVVGLQVSYATAVTSGGMARILPSQWDMNFRLRKIPDSVDDFTGFQKGLDLLGGDYLGYGPANDYYSTGKASVRNVRLPWVGGHSSIPDAEGLIEDPELRDFIENYKPTDSSPEVSSALPMSGFKGARILWAAEVWHGIKKHWVLELQRLIRARRS
jgi:hypothetical protein